MSTTAATPQLSPRGALLRSHLPLLASLLAGRDDAAFRLRAADPAAFLEFVRRHHVAATLAFLTNRPDLRAALRADMASALDAGRAAQAARSKKLIATLRTLEAAFRQEGVQPLLLKGVAFATRYYGAPDRRATRDIDVLVALSDLTHAERVLGALGYRRLSWAPFRRAAVHFTHAFDYASGGDLVDLHWTLARHPSFRFDLDGLRRRARTVDLGSVHVRTPDDGDALGAYLVSAFSDLQRRGLSARTLADLYQLLTVCDRTIDWPGFLEQRRQEGTYRIAVNMLAFALDTLEARPAFRGAAAVVDRARGTILLDAEGHRRLLTPSRYAPANKGWGLALYDASRAQSLCWWAASLPVRVLVHRGWRRGPRL